MRACKICLQKRKKLKYNTERMAICGYCVNALNGYKEVALDSYCEAGEMLRRGMIRRLEKQSQIDQPNWKRAAAEHELANFEASYHAALGPWLNRLTANPDNKAKMYKLIRAERRGLVHHNRPVSWGYPNRWSEVARKIRELDDYSCVICNARDVELHVHHLVYLSNFGTHRKQNLMTLCKKCHEKEHDREFDFGESPDGLVEVADDTFFAESSDESASQTTHVSHFSPEYTSPAAFVPEEKSSLEVISNLTPPASKEVSSSQVISKTIIVQNFHGEKDLMRDNGIELVNLKRLIVAGASREVIRSKIREVKKIYRLTDDEVIGRLAGFSDSLVLVALREAIAPMTSDMPLPTKYKKSLCPDIPVGNKLNKRVTLDETLHNRSECYVHDESSGSLKTFFEKYWLILIIAVFMIFIFLE